MSSDPNALYSRKNPFPGSLKINRPLTKVGSEKETRHFEISLEGSGMIFEVGDSIGVFSKNCPALVDEIITALEATGDEPVPAPDGSSKPLRQALIEDYQITQPDKKFLAAVLERADAAPVLADLLPDPERKKELEAFLWGLEIIDFLHDHPSAKFTPEEFVKLLRKLQPRLYSISSSLKAHPEQVHLTIAAVRYQTNGRERKGVCSTYLSDRAGEEPVNVFVHTAKGFRLPEDPATPVIMVGPGTGVAPFRAFLQERKATGATGKNWLFFGEQRKALDFLYEDEFAAYEKDRVLTKFSTAFSRDQSEKVYVQHRMMENAAEIWAWLEEGAHLFVCGDAQRMAKDVDVALHQIAEHQGKKSPEEAAVFIEQLKKDKRYKRDVY